MTNAKRKPRGAHGVRGGSGEANRLAIAILEVLGGMRTSEDAAQALGISLPRYYQLETRSVEGMVAACEPKPRGKQPSLQGRVASLEKQLEQAKRDCARQQALVRMTQRSLGLKTAPPANGETAKRDRAGRRKRRPTVRALKAAQALRECARSSQDDTVQPMVSSPEPLQTASSQGEHDAQRGRDA